MAVSYFYFSNKNLENENKLFRKYISNVYCSSTKGTRSEIQIVENSKTYYVSIDRSKCKSYKEGSYINLLYNKTFDYYFLPGRSNTDRLRIFILFTAFIISLLPWSKWFTFEKK